MRILVVGSGAREHTFVWKIVQSPLVEKVYCVPGNPGIAQIAECRVNSPRIPIMMTSRQLRTLQKRKR